MNSRTPIFVFIGILLLIGLVRVFRSPAPAEPPQTYTAGASEKLTGSVVTIHDTEITLFDPRSQQAFVIDAAGAVIRRTNEKGLFERAELAALQVGDTLVIRTGEGSVPMIDVVSEAGGSE